MKKTSLTFLASITIVAGATTIISCNKKSGNDSKTIIKTPSQKADVLIKKMVNKSVTLTETINLDLGVEANQTKVLNAIKGFNSLTNDEKNAIELVTKTGLITHVGLPVKVKLHNLDSKIVTFTVKRDLTSPEKANADIKLIKDELDKVTGDNLIIKLPSNTIGKIITNNKDSIEEQLRKIITKDDIGAIDNLLMKGVTISVSMDVDLPIATTAHPITVTLTKPNRTPIIINKFEVRRDLTSAEKANADIKLIKDELDKVTRDNLIIKLPSNTIGKIITNNKDSIEEQLRKIITKDDIGAIDNLLMKGVTISVSMDVDLPIATTAHPITITLTKIHGTTIRIVKFKVRKELTSAEKANADIKLIKDELDKVTRDNLIIKLPSNTIGKIITNNKDSIEEQLRKIITKDDIGAIDNLLMKGVTISALMSPDSLITTTAQDITVELTKVHGTTITINNFKVKRELTTTEKANADISFIQEELDKVTGDDLTIKLPSGTTGSIIANNLEKILKEIRKKVTKDNVGAIDNLLMKGVTISALMSPDSLITTTAQDITVELTKVHGTTITINNFKVKRELTSAEKANADISSIQEELDKVTGDDLTIKLSSGTTGNIIANNLEKILKEIRKKVTKDNVGAIDNLLMKGVTISALMSPDSLITTTAQDITVELTKVHGTTITINNFKVKRELTSAEKANADISSIQEELDKVTGDDLTIKLPSGTTGNIIANNLEKILKEIRKKVTKDNVGAIDNLLMKGVTISALMSPDSLITTTAQDITVELTKVHGTTITINNFKVKRELTTTEKANADISFIQEELDKVTGDDLTIKLPSGTTGSIIANNLEKILKEIRKKVTKDNVGAIDNLLMKGVTISALMSPDSLITTTAQDITVELTKVHGTTITINNFKVKRELTILENSNKIGNTILQLVKEALNTGTADDFIIKLPKETTTSCSTDCIDEVKNHIKSKLKGQISKNIKKGVENILLDDVKLFIDIKGWKVIPVVGESIKFNIEIQHKDSVIVKDIKDKFKYQLKQDS